MGAAKLIVAGIFAIYLFERMAGSLPQKSAETFEAALLLVILTVAQAVPLLAGGYGRIGPHLLNLAVAGLAIVLCRMPLLRSGAVWGAFSPCIQGASRPVRGSDAALPPSRTLTSAGARPASPTAAISLLSGRLFGPGQP